MPAVQGTQIDLTTGVDTTETPCMSSASTTITREERLENLMIELNEKQVNAIANLSGSMSNAFTEIHDALHSVEKKFTSDIDELRTSFAALKTRMDIIEGTHTSVDRPVLTAAGSKARRVTFNNRFTNRANSQPPSGADQKAMKPNCCRLKGFCCRFPRDDIKGIAVEFLKHMKIETHFVEAHAGSVTASVVCEFVSQDDAKKAVEISKASGKIQWKENGSDLVHNLFLCWDESAESRAAGIALHFLYDAAKEIIVPKCPAGSTLGCDKGHGILQIAIARRYHTIAQIEADPEDPESFRIMERKGTTFVLPPYITEEMVSNVIAKAMEAPCFI